MSRVEEALALAASPGLGPRTYLRLKEHFGSDAAILGASVADLAQVEGVSASLTRTVAAAHEYDPRPELERAAEVGACILSQDDEAYPKALKESYDPPIVLYVRGTLQPEDALALAVVGTRQPTQYGRAQAERFAGQFARLGLVVVSGLARGIDSVAHRACLQAGGRTLAVLGSGLGRIYPRENRDLASAISAQGAVLSEYPVDTGPSRENFPKRNRLIAALAFGTLVVEAPRRSGSLITARLANELGREVFALPGRIDQRQAAGGNHLIASGQAKLIQSLECVLEELGPLAEALGPPPPAADGAATTADPREASLLAAIPAGEETHIDQVCAATGLPAHEVAAGLMMLELKRAVRQLPGRFFTRSAGAGAPL